MNNKNKRKVWGKRFEKWTPFFIIICTIFGSVLGSIIYYSYQGEFPYEVLIGSIVVAIILIIIEVIKRTRKKDRLPQADERIIHNVFRFSGYISHIILAVLFIMLGIYTLLGEESISIFNLWIFFFAYIWIIGIGVFIVKRR